MYRKGTKEEKSSAYDSRGNGLNDGWPIYKKLNDEGLEELIAVVDTETLADSVLKMLTESYDKPFRDIDGDRYGSEVTYHQAMSVGHGVHVDKDGQRWPSFAVWLNVEACKALFPGQPINSYVKDQIAEPWFVDKPGRSATIEATLIALNLKSGF